MPAVIPIVAAFASGAAGAVIAGTAGFAAYASVAGAVLSTVGALTGSKALGKIGMVLSLGGGIANMVGGAASAGADAAVSGMDLAADGGANSVANAAASSGLGGAAADAATSAAASSAASMAGDTASSLGAADPNVLGGNYDFGAGATAPQVTAPTTGMPTTPTDAGSLGNTGFGGGLMDAAANNPTPGSLAPTTQMPTGGAAAPVDPVSQAGQGLNWKDIQSFYDKAGKAISGVGQWANKNPVLANAGLNALSNAYGPQAERLDMEKSLMDRARANLNSPVKINFNKGG